MGLSVDYLFKFTLSLMKKNQAGGLSATDFQYFWNEAQIGYQQNLLGPWQQANNTKTGINTGLIEDETILQKLSPFTTPASLSITSGNVSKPTDFIFRLAFRVNGVDVYKINHGQIGSVNGDSIDPPSVVDNKFYFVEYNSNYYLLPHTLPTSSITTADLDYITTPRMIVWGFTYDTIGNEVYSPSGIAGLDVIYGGVGYTTPTITFSAPATGGVQATATLTVVSGVISQVVMTNNGVGYAELSPTFTITGSSTTPASFGSPIVSVDSQWDAASEMEITKRMFKTLGVSFKDKDFESFGQSIINTGN